MELDDRDTEAGAGIAASPFVFVGEALALDLINTTVVSRSKPRDLLDTPGDLAAWWRAAEARYPAAIAEIIAPEWDWDTTLLAAVKGLRAALRGIFTAVAGGGAVAVTDLAALNRALGVGRQQLAASSDGELRAIASAGSGGDVILLAVALSALRLLTAAERGRLHRCGNERCVLLFYDTTKSATRRWCSTACMNRARSIRRYRQQRRASNSAVAPG